jgi:hypothetical protein
VASVAGFSLHADTHAFGRDRQGLERLVRYAARGPLAQSRLTREEDGRYRYQCKRGKALVLTASALLKRLLALEPPERMHLTSYRGVFGPNAKKRPLSLGEKSPAREEVPGPRKTLLPRLALLEGQPQAGDGAEAPLARSRRPRLDWATLQRRTFGADVWKCRCGGEREVLAVVTSRTAAEELLRKLGLLERSKKRVPAQAQSPPSPQLNLEYPR